MRKSGYLDAYVARASWLSYFAPYIVEYIGTLYFVLTITMSVLRPTPPGQQLSAPYTIG